MDICSLSSKIIENISIAPAKSDALLRVGAGQDTAGSVFWERAGFSFSPAHSSTTPLTSPPT